MHRCLSRLVAALFVIAAAGPVVGAPAPKSTVKADPVAAEAIRKALDATGKFEFTELNLSAVLNTIAEHYKISIVLDRAVLQQMGFEPEGMPVELKMKEGKLRNALRALVGQYNLTFAIVGDALLITTEEVAVYRQLKQRISVDYDAVPLSKAIKELSTKYGVNVVMDPRAVKSKSADNPVTLQVEDVPFEAAVRLMCEMAELKPARMGNVIFVTTEARADKLRDGDSLVPAPTPPAPTAPGLMPGFGGLGGGIGGAVPGVINPPPAPPAVAPPVVDTPPAKDPAKKD
jgi:hypothetical protein